MCIRHRRLKQFRQCNTDTTYIPGGCTSLIQPLDVSFNKPFMNAVEWLATEHMKENLEAYVKGEHNAVLFTKWVGQAWDEVSAKKEMVVSSFKKCGISVAIDGSEDSEIHIKGLEDYVVEGSDSVEEYTDEEDPFADFTEAV